MIKHVHVVLVGRMGSGKTTLLKALENRGFSRVVSVTTRPPRPGEVDKVDYIFTDDRGFDSALAWNDLIAVRSYDTVFGTWRYGVPLNELKINVDTVQILDLEGLKEFRDSVPNSFAVYLDASEELCRYRAMSRGDDPNEVDRRLADDRRIFSKFDNNAKEIEQVFEMRCSSDMNFGRSPQDEADRIVSYIRTYKEQL